MHTNQVSSRPWMILGCRRLQLIHQRQAYPDEKRLDELRVSVGMIVTRTA
jgi:hypothetical protein